MLTRVIHNTLANRVSATAGPSPGLATNRSAEPSGSTTPASNLSDLSRRRNHGISSTQYGAQPSATAIVFPGFHEEPAVQRAVVAVGEQHLSKSRSSRAILGPSLIRNPSDDIIVASAFDDTSTFAGWATIITTLVPEHRLTGSFKFTRTVPHDHLPFLATPVLPSSCRRLISISEIENRRKVASSSIHPKTLNSYGGCIARYLGWCDSEEVDSTLPFPMDWNNMRHYFDHLAAVSRFRESTIRHYASAFRFWSLTHGLEWNADRIGLDMVYKATKNISPLGKAPRRPVELPDLDCLIRLLEVSEPEDLAVIA